MFSQRAVTRSFFILVCLVVPSSLRADDPVDIGAALDRAIVAYEKGDRVEALKEIDHAQAALRAELAEIPVGVLRNLAELDRALAIYRLYVRGHRPDLDATHDAVANLIGELRFAYRERDRSIIDRFIRAEFDLDGRVDQLGEVEIDYAPFSDRISAIGEIEVDYVPFSERPRSIGAIEFRWVFDELYDVGGVSVDDY